MSTADDVAFSLEGLVPGSAMAALTPEFKRCPRCGIVKASSEFRANRAEPDGLQRYCRPCQIEVNRKSRLKNPDKPREVQRRHQARHRDEQRERVEAWKAAHPENHRANKFVSNAVRDGRLVRPETCDRCGCGNDIFQIQAHLKSFALPIKPEDIDWLCAPCHGEIHRPKVLA